MMKLYKTSFNAAVAKRYIDEYNESIPNEKTIATIDSIMENTFKKGHTTASFTLAAERKYKKWESIESYYRQLGYDVNTIVPSGNDFVIQVNMQIYPHGTIKESFVEDYMFSACNSKRIPAEQSVSESEEPVWDDLLSEDTDGEEDIEGITMWIARNKDGRLKLYAEKPVRAPEKAIYEAQNFWHISDLSTNTEIAKMGTFINNSMCPYLTWEDDPIKVELTITSNKDE